MTERAIMVAVVRADMIISAALSLPWRRIVLSLALALATVEAVRRAWRFR